jgi:predicted CopG family antitoxin
MVQVKRAAFRSQEIVMASSHRNGKANTQTVEIDRQAYERLEEAREPGESYSEVIKRCVRPRQSAEEILRAMRRAAVSPATLRAIEESASRRRRTGHKPKG